MCIGEEEVIVHDQWRIVDRWWTDEPLDYQYRDVTIDGRRRVEKRRMDSGENWTECEES